MPADETVPLYMPRPVNTSDVRLPDDLEALVERLAANAHDVWAAARMSAGWVWGPSRCDDRRHHPCLVEYAELPEAEKEYDRSAVVSTLKVVLALGYRVVKET
jgi:ryanodine receptor 2